MAKDTLIDKHVSTKQCEKAIEALLKYTQKRRAEEDESTLFRDEEQAIWLVIALKQIQPNAYKLKPHRMYVLAALCTGSG
jgi:ribosome biogenesis protein UTP30